MRQRRSPLAPGGGPDLASARARTGCPLARPEQACSSLELSWGDPRLAMQPVQQHPGSQQEQLPSQSFSRCRAPLLNRRPLRSAKASGLRIQPPPPPGHSRLGFHRRRQARHDIVATGSQTAAADTTQAFARRRPPRPTCCGPGAHDDRPRASLRCWNLRCARDPLRRSDFISARPSVAWSRFKKRRTFYDFCGARAISRGRASKT